MWGTDIYTDDSSICTAAAHARLITLEEGGEVTFAFTEGPDVYPASERNGVTSVEGRDWPRGFEFVDPSWSRRCGPHRFGEDRCFHKQGSSPEAVR